MNDHNRPLRPEHAPGLDLATVPGEASGRVGGITLDSRAVLPGDLYVGLPGARAHGASFAAQAREAGAVALLTDAAGAHLARDAGLPILVDADPRAAMGELAARIYGRPSERLGMFGVTGTNGKTSTVHLLEAALTALGRHVGTIGTIGFRIDGRRIETPRGTVTTPDAPDLQAMLARMADWGANAIAMEVSSHALALHRVAGITFDVAGFTMFGQDHLDFHPSLDDYFGAKTKLFLGGRCRTAVVNIDDPWGRTLADLVQRDGRARLVTTAVDRPADYRVTAWEPRPDGGSHVRLSTPGGEIAYEVAMIGDFNVRNSLTALAMVGAAGLDVAAAARGLADAHVPGRMQRVDLGDGRPFVVVDFAHTPQAVEAALASLPATGRRIAVLGAGGDRDASKRPLMGAAAARGADVVVVTDDNPRSEDPAAIRAAVLDGARGAGSGAQIVDGGDRRAALARALELARPGDWIAVLGKGHETGQIVGDRLTPFDDVEVVRDLAGGAR